MRQCRAGTGGGDSPARSDTAGAGRNAAMKVAILNEKYHSYVSGDAEKSVKILADALADRGA